MLFPECCDSGEVERADNGLTQAERLRGHQVHGHWVSTVTKIFDNHQQYLISHHFVGGCSYPSSCLLVLLSINTACHLDFISYGPHKV